MSKFGLKIGIEIVELVTLNNSYECCGCSFAAFFGFTVTLIYITDLIILMYHRKQRLLEQDQPEVHMTSNGGPRRNSPPSTAEAWSANQRY